MSEEMKECPECGQIFDNVFDATDHLLEEDEEFDPALILPSGYRLMIGSLLRCFYDHADEPDNVRKVAEDTYATLFLAETAPHLIVSTIEDMIVGSSMVGIDEELRQLLKDGEE